MNTEPSPSSATSWKLSPKALFRNFFTTPHNAGEPSQGDDDSLPMAAPGANLPDCAPASSPEGVGSPHHEDKASGSAASHPSGSLDPVDAAEMGPPSNEPAAETPKLGRKKQIREKRVLPARMRRVSSLLAGSETDGDLLADSEPVQHQRLFPDTTVFILASDASAFRNAFEGPDADAGVDGPGFVAATACREKAMIETPDFQLRDDSVQMGKTRGGAVKSEEDTSDAAYERRHRKGDNLEKKQRRLEKERLVRDRQKLKERIEQLKTADPRMLVPIFAARESHRASTPGASSLRGSEATLGLGKQNLSAEANATLQKIENLRKELVAEASDTLLRYDALLAEAPPAVSAHKKRKLGNEDVDASPVPPRGRQGATRDGPLAGHGQDLTLRTPSNPASSRMPTSGPSTAEPRGRRRRSSALQQSDDTPSKTVSVVAEHQHHNIHARTSGGRFAPKSALAKASPTSAATSRGKGAADSINDDSPVQPRKPRALRPCEMARKAAKEAARAASASSQAAPVRGRSARSSSAAYDDAHEQQRRANKTGPSLAELTAAERRPKRVKLILGSRPAIAEGDAQSHAEEGDDMVGGSPNIKLRSGSPSTAQASATPAFAAGAIPTLTGSKTEASEPLASEPVNFTRSTQDTRTPPLTGQDANLLTIAAPFNLPDPKGSDAPFRPGANSDVSTNAVKAEVEQHGTLIKREESEVSLGRTDLPTPSPCPAPRSGAPTAAYMPGRSAAARERAAANIPARRSSGRVKEMSTGAFGEKVPPQALQREDFEKIFLQAHRSWEVARRSSPQADNDDNPLHLSESESTTLPPAASGNGGLEEVPPGGHGSSAAMDIKEEEVEDLVSLSKD